MNHIQIERKSKVLLADIAREYLHGVGKPIIITDATESWPARSKWTFDFFKTAYGSDPALAWLGLGSGAGKLTTLSAYINYLDAPMSELPGIWSGSEIGEYGRLPPRHVNSPFYLMGWFAFRQHAELYEDIKPAPYFVQDLVSALDPTLRDILEWASQREYTAVYIGPAGSLSALHRDFWHTHAYLAQIQGRKRAILFSPMDSTLLYDGRVDPEQPDLEQFPLFDRATAYECVIGPGDTLLIPAKWWHHVRGLEKSITVSHNFFNDSNLTQYLTHILRCLPALVDGINKSPNWREEMCIEWRPSDFLSPNTAPVKKAPGG